MITKIKFRKLAWWLLGGSLLWQFYFVQQLIVALALFAMAFTAVAIVVVSIYMLQKAWEVAVERLLSREKLAGRSLKTRVPVREIS